MKRWLALVLSVVAALAIVAVPVWLIQPFSPQTKRALEVGYLLRAWSPVATLVLAALAVWAVVAIWRGTRRRWAKALAVVVLLPIFPAVWFTRQNHFEWMFNPLQGAAYASAADAGSFVGADDMVLAVEVNGERVAYPVRLMAYHHLAADVVGGTPLVATY